MKTDHWRLKSFASIILSRQVMREREVMEERILTECRRYESSSQNIPDSALQDDVPYGQLSAFTNPHLTSSRTSMGAKLELRACSVLSLERAAV